MASESFGRHQSNCKGQWLDTAPEMPYNRFMIEKMIRVGQLYDLYGALLTERQRKCLELHFLQDWSLGEIAAEFGVSRQAVNDILRRSEETLEEYELALNLLKQETQRTARLNRARSLLTESIRENPSAKVSQALTEINTILEQEVGTE